MCRKNAREKEKHIFLDCSTTHQAQQTLSNILKTKQACAINNTFTLSNITKLKKTTSPSSPS